MSSTPRTENDGRSFRPVDVSPKIGYVSGPVDARVIYADAMASREPEYFGTSYLAQLLQLAHRRGARAVVITTLAEQRYDVRIDGHRLVNVSPSEAARAALRYHITMTLWALRVLRVLWHEQVDVVVLTAGQNYHFMFAPLRLRGTKIVVSLHSLVWPKFGRIPRVWTALRWLNNHLIFRHAAAIQGVSQDIRDQIISIQPSAADRTSVFRPTYNQEQFENVRPLTFGSNKVFSILFVGRIEVSKGVFDMLSVAQRLRADGRMPRFRIDFCGEGAALDELRKAVDTHTLSDLCFVHGVCDAERIRSFLGGSDVVVVPTRSELEEGYNKVCAEAVLAGRPVVTSAACPALADVADAAVEVQVDDVAGYADAILRLATDEALFRAKAEATQSVRQKYFDIEASYGARLEAALDRIGIFAAK
jgi:glycogen synthase